MRQQKVLFVDDEPIILKTVGRFLEANGLDVVTANNGITALELVSKGSFDLVLTDLNMEPLDGIGVLKKVKEINPNIMVIMLTGYGDVDAVINALRLGVDDYMLKPADNKEILFRIRKSLEKLELKNKIKVYKGILPICCQCKKIRDDSGREPGTGTWVSVEKFIWEKAGLSPSSSYCPDCLQKVHEQINELET